MDTSKSVDSAKTVDARVTTTLGSTGTMMQQGLKGAAAVHRGRLAQQQRTAADLAKQYGPEDPRVKSAQTKAARTQFRLARLNGLHEQSATTRPAVSANSWALQGRVYDAQSKPLPELTVFLVNSDKIWLRQYGFSYTDNTGLFLLQGAMPEHNNAPMYIEIADRHGVPIYIGSAAFLPYNGQAAYQKITLTSQTPLGDPPQRIRMEGMPDASYGES